MLLAIFTCMTIFDFINKKMRMSHIYQPLFIKTLIEHDGRCNRKDIAGELLLYDNSQLEYYEKIVDTMPGKVLRGHNIVTRIKGVKDYVLNDYESLTEEDRVKLIKLCQNKIDGYMDKRGDAIWEHRSKNRKSVSGSIRYKVLKRAKGRCELCGISKEIKALEVDHIVPKNWLGEDSINNYQALCFTCNANKRDTDDEDFRDLEERYNHSESDCIFCNCDSTRIIGENNLAYVIEDKYPVTEHHSLVIPKRHSDNYFNLYQPEINAINDLIKATRTEILSKDDSVKAFNIGMNNGEIAGQTIMHTHVHLIPRRDSDVTNPIGGVRNVIPGKGQY